MTLSESKKLALQIIDGFPKSKNGQPFLTLKNGKKCFFSIFVKKYGINGSLTKYSENDVIRRLRFIECFDFFTKNYDVVFDRHEKEKQYYIIETHFFRFVLVEQWNKRLEFLSFYPK